MWIGLAFGAAFLSGVAAIFRKAGVRKSDPYQTGALSLTAAFVTILVVAVAMGQMRELVHMDSECLRLTIVSGIVQGFSWLTYMLAIKYTTVSIVAALDKCNVIATMLLAFFMVGETITWIMLTGTVLLLIGTKWVVGGSEGEESLQKGQGIFWGIVSPILMAVSNVIAKMDTSHTNPVLTTGIRIFAVTIILWIFAFIKAKPGEKIRNMQRESLLASVWSGILTGVFNIMMYQAIAIGVVSVVTAIIKGGFLVAVIFAVLFLKETLDKKGWVGFFMVCLGIAAFVL